MPTIGEVFDAIERDLETNQRQAGEELAVDLKYKVSVPVQYATGPRGGRRVIRSISGEPPRKESGRLQASIESETIMQEPGVAETALTVSAPYAARLQEKLNRPITDDESDRAEELFIDAAEKAVNG